MAPSFSLAIYKMILGQKIDIDDLIEEFDQGEVIKNLEKLRYFTDDSMFWQSFVYEDVRLVAGKRVKEIKEQEHDS